MGSADPNDAAGVSSSLSGRAKDVVQARDISGGIHFHSASIPTVAIPRLLRADVAGFVGRVRELEALAGAAQEHGGLRLAVVVGTAGAGKTSLALRFAHQVRTAFPDGDLFVNLRGYDVGPPVAPGAVLERFLRALGVPAGEIPQDLEDRAGLYRSLLAGRKVLVVLDNAATAGQVRPLLPGDGRPLVVVTSRSRLSGLTARDGARRISLGLLDLDSAVALIEAATSGYRNFDSREQVAELAQLCARLPLALRIAAERAAARPLMPLGELIAELRSGSGMWEALSADDGQESDAVRTVFAWSYRALPDSAARAFRLLGLHPGPEFGIGAAAALLGMAHAQARTMLDVLAGAHLLEQISPTRFGFHDLLRAFSADTADADEPPDERQLAFGRVHQWYLRSARAASRLTDNARAEVAGDEPVLPGVEPESFAGLRQVADWYATERHNLLALIQALEQAGDAGSVFRLAVTIRSLIFTHGLADDRQPVAEAALRGARAAGDLAAQARALRDLGSTARLAGDLQAALVHSREALAAYAAVGDFSGSADAANSLALVLLAQHDLDQALQVLTDAVERARAVDQRRWAAILQTNIGYALELQGEFEAALEAAARALAELSASGYQGSMFFEAYGTMVRANTGLERWDAAHRVLQDAERIAAIDGSPAVQAVLLADRAELDLATGRAAEAEDLLWQAQNLGRALGDLRQQALVLTAAGRAQLMLGRAEQAVDFHRRAVELRRTMPDAVSTAEALAYLADALADTGSTSEAAAARAEAARLLTQYDDRRAAAVRIRLAASGEESGP